MKWISTSSPRALRFGSTQDLLNPQMTKGMPNNKARQGLGCPGRGGIPPDERRGRMGLSRRISFVAMGAGVIVALTAGPAAAHECFVASRSAQGNAAVAAHSHAWLGVSLDRVLTEFIGVPQDVADCVITNASTYGIPASFVLGGKQAVGQDGVIAGHNPNMEAKGLATDGKGIDHAEDLYGPALFAAIQSCTP